MPTGLAYAPGIGGYTNSGAWVPARRPGSTSLTGRGSGREAATVANQITNPYAGQASKLVGGAMDRLGGKDYTAALQSLLQEDVARRQGKQAAGFRQLGMGELALATDIQHDWSKEMQSASTQAAVTGAEMQRGAYSTLANIIQSASGQELEYMLGKLQGLLGAGNLSNSYMSMMIPLLVQKGQQDAASSTPRF